ncbi:TetR family transcriptional regulator [Murinocardiopsis flavida]|uniref:TetR family transcriptional regulator n=1 Tax=Murinocardiopsis flavida TaxID=645275 RepID=A0A2P8DDR2_9ACTN|nr:TetR family transcriptional regulator [Murinocardiopsis flavida]PSK95371.1 TetR family transcriptional regulator [Murinocardiopsis flavida]
MAAPDPEDLTARARIRDAAMQQFGEHGFARATIRGIAEAAGVSSGLVRHHFGSKQALREACDAHLTKLIRALNADARSFPAVGPRAPSTAMRPYERYLARALTEGAACAVFDDMVTLSESWQVEADAAQSVPPETDPRVRATIGTAMALAIPVLRSHISRGLGVDTTEPEGERLLLRALVDIYSHPILGTDEAAEIRAALDGTPPHPPRPGTGPAPADARSDDDE